MTSSISSASGRSPTSLAAGFLGAFIVGSLAVQLVRSQPAAVQAGAAGDAVAAAALELVLEPLHLRRELPHRILTYTASQES